MSRVSDILDRFVERYPSPEHDWRFRAGRLAEEIELLEKQLADACDTIRGAATWVGGHHEMPGYSELLLRLRGYASDVAANDTSSKPVAETEESRQTMVDDSPPTVNHGQQECRLHDRKEPCEICAGYFNAVSSKEPKL